MIKYFCQHLTSSNFFFYKSNIYLIYFLLLSTTNIYTQTLSAEKIYKKVSDAVVVIYAYDSNNQLKKQGSGVVINSKNIIVTNYHIFEGCERIEILHNKKNISYIDITGIDVDKDILILKIGKIKFPTLKIGNSKNLNIGQRVYAIGSPLGFENSISEGIISGLRNYDDIGRNFIQITASISPGSSGGAVVNDEGEIIGISTLTIRGGQNLNFAIPIDEVLNVKNSSYSKNKEYKNFEWYSQGLDAIDKGNFQDALKYFTNYISIYPNDASAYYNRGGIKLELGDYKEAIQDYDKAIELESNLEEAYNNRGSTKKSLGDYRGAIQDFDKAIEINPNDAEAYYNRGSAKGQLEDYSGAIIDLNKAVEINPNDTEAYNNRGIVKAKMKKYREAILDYNKAIDINPNNANAYYNRGTTKGSLEDYRGAIKDFNKAIEIIPNYSEAYFNRGLVKYQLRDRSGACSDWSKAGELGIGSAYDVIREYCN